MEDPLRRSDSVGVYGGMKRFSVLPYPLQMPFRYISAPVIDRAVDGDRGGKAGELLDKVVRSAYSLVYPIQEMSELRRVRVSERDGRGRT